MGRSGTYDACAFFEQAEKAMRTRFMVLGVVLGLVLATASGGHAEVMPSVDDLQAQMEAPAGTVTVYEPHLSVGDAHVAVDYVGYLTALPVLP